MEKIFKWEFNNTRNDKSELALKNKLDTEKKFLYGAIDAGYEYNEKGYYHKRENGVCYLLLYTVSGQAVCEYKNTEILLTPGSILFISLAEQNVIKALDSHWEIYFMNLLGGNLDEIYRFVTQHSGYLLNLFNAEKLIENVKTVCKLYKQTEINHFEISELIYSVLLDVAKQSQPKDMHPQIQKAISYINANYHKPFSVEQICKDLFISKYFFIRKFHEETGYSPKQYVNNLRLKKAKYLLAKTKDSIIKIAQDVGFESEKNIYYAFKKDLGISPKEYRENFL